MTNELKPCPFCPPDKSNPTAFVEPDGYMEHAGNVYRGFVGCEHCGIGIEMYMSDLEIPDEWWKDSPEDEPKGFLAYLMNLWNTRYKRTCKLVENRRLRGSWPDCSKCGKPIQRNSKFCPKCGAEVVDDD